MYDAMISLLPRSQKSGRIHTTLVIPQIPPSKIDDLASKLEKSGMFITYLDRNKYIIKIRQKLFYFDGCGRILHFDNKN